jgi:hypothetical protein
MSLLTLDAILAADQLKFEDVAVPEWGGTVRVRAMTGAERDAIGAVLADKTKSPNFGSLYAASVTATCVVGEDGAPLFGLDKIEVLRARSVAALDRVYQAAMRLNSASVEDVEKNSLPDPSAG